jgi:DNA polymerase
VNGWRAAHPRIVQGWWDLQDAAIEAVSTPGAVISVFGGRVKYLVANGFLFCALPSGRVIAYAAPRLKYAVRPGAFDRNGKPLVRRYVEFDGLDSETKRWCPQSMYGGFQDENIVQAISRDVMVVAMHAAEAEGYPIVLTMHDELLCEVDDTPERNAAGLQSIMSRLPAWAHGLPLAAAAWEDKRYVK